MNKKKKELPCPGCGKYIDVTPAPIHQAKDWIQCECGYRGPKPLVKPRYTKEDVEKAFKSFAGRIMDFESFLQFLQTEKKDIRDE